MAKPYNGPHRKLVIAFDVGTTFSGIAYSLLDPGEAPQVHGVTRFPGQENAAGDSKIPSILYYNLDGSVRAVGAEAALPHLALDAEDEGLLFIEWFKLHLRPSALASEDAIKARVPPLPLNKSVVDVFADFLRYLFACARRYITESHGNGESLWKSVENNIEFVLTHPNGWEGNQQAKMRRAAIMAGLVPDTATGHSRVHFVSEGEASLHFCVRSGLATETIQNGKTVMIVDAGGGTVDLSTYTFTTISPMSVEEVVAPDCIPGIMQGSTTVNVRARNFLQAKLARSTYRNDEDIKTMMDAFEKSAKPIFKDAGESAYIKFGSMGCNDPAVGIRRGQLILAGSDVASFFRPAVCAIVGAVEKQSKAITAAGALTTVFLVGGFAASPWLYSQLKDALCNSSLNVARPDRHTSKAVAEGAILHYLEQWVSVRVTRITYGVECITRYNPLCAEHVKRRDSVFSEPSGGQVLPHCFSVILPKGKRIQETEEFSHRYFCEAREASTLNSISVEITCYIGKSTAPSWTDNEPEMFSTLCTVHADTSLVRKAKRKGKNGTYYKLDYKVVLLCGLTELKAQISWIENVSG
ncbi:hypothetical protein IEO21_06256 [Rhodonia placenta]|uniref:Uncharacterized protein n=1 Tax=Rhodonia placenta TaxID=104341 RepID=A0A8H7P0F8_9APHY|nr:hypothetical protein IEO21_06256 [Postia placenta]